MRSSAFLSDSPVLLRPGRSFSRRSRTPLRRPRAHSVHARWRRTLPCAVFLPPEGVPSVPDDDDEDSELTGPFEDEGSSRRSANQVGSVDSLLQEMKPEYDTWKDRNERRSLTSMRGTSEYQLGADELNEMLKGDHLKRHREVLAPDEAFGAIFLWDVVVRNSRELELRAWQAVAREKGYMEPDWDDVVRAENMAPEAAISRVFLWTREWPEVKRLLFRKHELEAALHPTFEYRAALGVGDWVRVLGRYGVSCVLCASRPRARVLEVLKRMGLETVFKKNDLICAEDEFDSLEQMLLTAALKCDRPPQKCVVFTDRVDAITAAHEVSAKVVALMGVHKAYEVKSADASVSEWPELVVYNVRRLFAEQGDFFPQPQTQVESME